MTDEEIKMVSELMSLAEEMADVLVAEFSFDGEDRQGIKVGRYQELVNETDEVVRALKSPAPPPE